MNATNPVADENPLNAIEHCRAVLSYMTVVKDTDFNDETIDFGRSLILRTVIEALAQVQQELKSPTGAA